MKNLTKINNCQICDKPLKQVLDLGLHPLCDDLVKIKSKKIVLFRFISITMKRLILVLSILFFVSCDYFVKKKIDTKTIVNDELKSINWNDVDEYPTFSICDSTNNKKECFQNVLRDRLNAKLSNQNIVVTEDVNDTILLRIYIDSEGVFSIKSIECSDITKAQIPQLDSLLRHSFDSLPKIFPAIKRSQQVATEFSLPVIVNIN